jgi:nucleoprotein TPR
MQALKDEIEQLKAQKDEQTALLSDKSERVSHAQPQQNPAHLLRLKIEALEANLRSHRETNAKNMQGFKTRLGALNTEKSKLSADIVEHQNQIKALTMERDTLRTTLPSDSSTQLAQQVEVLHREKAALEKMLAEEKAAKVAATGKESTDEASLFVRRSYSTTCVFV